MPYGYQAIPLTVSTGQSFQPSQSGNPISSAGRVAGSTTVVTDQGEVSAAAVYYLPNRTIRALRPPGSSYSLAMDINDLGQVVGLAGYPHRAEQAFVWTSKTGTYRLLERPDALSAIPYAINDHGMVVGSFVSTDYHQHAFVSDPGVDGGRMRDIGSLDGDETARAVGLNNAGEVIGYSKSDHTQVLRSFLWRSTTGAMTDLGHPAGAYATYPNDINDAGFVVGASSYVLDGSADSTQGRAWVLNPVTHDFRLLPAAAGGVAEARAINRHGVIVGISTASEQVAMLWNACGSAGQVLDDNNRGADATFAAGINRYERVLGVDQGVPTVWRRPDGPCRR